MSVQGITILGSTGSIGVNTLDVIRSNSNLFKVVALTACRNKELLLQQCKEFQPAYAVLADDSRVNGFAQDLKTVSPGTRLLVGAEGLNEVSRLDEVDQVMAAIVGAAGLIPTLSAAGAGKRVLLANKEALVMSGALLMNTIRENGSELLPIDSEHNAIFQSLPDGKYCDGVEKILLTASGGPFLNMPADDLALVTPEQACAHPNWVMGRKISVDSATMMNKGLELIEACWIFNVASDQITIVIHPQSIVHSMVAYKDGSVLAQMGNPDMRTPIAHAMAWPRRIDSGVDSLDLTRIASLQFETPDEERFPALRLAREACEAGGSASIVLNAANEVSVEAFLNRQIAFSDLINVVEHCLQQEYSHQVDELEGILSVDNESRKYAMSFIETLS